MNTFRTAAMAFACLSAAAATAADIGPGETIVVTATRNEIPLDDAIVPVTVITRDDIELSLATDLAELLRFEAGIDVGRNGGPGQATSIFMRGTESNHTLVLVDGVRVNPGTIGGAAIQHMAPEAIERVEIVKGARSALFGTDAIGGVVNIITRRAQSPYVEASAGGGSFDSRTAYVSAGSRGETSELGFTLNRQNTGGYAPRTDSDVERGYENLSANIYAARRFGTGEVSIRHWQTEGVVEYLDFFLTPVDQDFRNATTAMEWRGRIAATGSTKLILSYTEDAIAQNQAEDFVESSRTSIDWQYSRVAGAHTVTAGLFGMDEQASTLSFGAGFDESTAVRAAFLQDQWSRGRHRSFAAVRLTDHETFGDHATWNVEYAFDLSDAWTFNAGLGHAFRAPDATDRFGYGGRADLEPEIADEMQFGLRYAPGARHRIDLEYYANDIEDLIEFDVASFTLDNIDAAEIRGLQLGYEFRGERFALRAEVVRQSADNANTGMRLLRRAENSASLAYTHDLGRHRVGISVLASGDRVDVGGVRLGGYVLTNLTGQFRVGDGWTLASRIENLFDTKYATAAGFRMQERSAFVELKYRWQ